MRKINKILITGINGSGGSYLADYILQNHKNVKVHGISRWHSTNSDNIYNFKNKVNLHECDMNDFSFSLLNVLKKVKPDCIFHLAAYANVKVYFINPSTVPRKIIFYLHLIF